MKCIVFALWLLCAMAQSAAAATPAGTIDSLAGKVTIVGKNGVSRPANAGTSLFEGDLVESGADGWALLDMDDGATLTLRAATRLRIDSYRFEGDANDNSVLSLLRGTFRAVTGLIGRTARSNYKIVTPNATIGVRGTDHEPAYYPPGESGEVEPGTYDKVNAGETVLRNADGETAISPGQAAFVHHLRRERPRLLATAPAFYQRHAEFDRGIADRLRRLHERQQQRLEQRQQLRQRRMEKQSEHGAARPWQNERATQREERQNAVAEQRRERMAREVERGEERAQEAQVRRGQGGSHAHGTR